MVLYNNVFRDRMLYTDVARTLRQTMSVVWRKLSIGVCLRTVVLIFCITFFWVQMHISDVADNETIQILAKPDGLLDANDSMLQLVPQVRFIPTKVNSNIPVLYTYCIH